MLQAGQWSPLAAGSGRTLPGNFLNGPGDTVLQDGWHVAEWAAATLGGDPNGKFPKRFGEGGLRTLLEGTIAKPNYPSKETEQCLHPTEYILQEMLHVRNYSYVIRHAAKT